jgi:hypothetical protein
MHVRVRAPGELVRPPSRHDSARGGRYAGPKHGSESLECGLGDGLVITLFELHSCGARGEGEKDLWGGEGAVVSACMLWEAWARSEGE